MKKIGKHINDFIEDVTKHHVGAYASQSAFFMVMCLIPIILLLLTLVQYTPISRMDVIEVVYELFPSSIRTTIMMIVNEVYEQSKATIPITIIVAMWSAGKAVMAITNGLNTIHNYAETRNYIVMRIRAALYTVSFVLAIVMMMVLLGFGNSISILVNEHFPVARYVTDIIIRLRTVGVFIVVILVTLAAYRFLPSGKQKIRYHFPGAIFTTIGWLLISYFISIYMDVFKGFANMYGSLTTIVLIMLWLYFCMYIILLGEEINLFISERLDIKEDCDKIEQD